MTGFLTTIYTMCGYDAPFHLSEECSNANIAGPRAIVMTAQLGLYLGKHAKGAARLYDLRHYVATV